MPPKTNQTLHTLLSKAGLMGQKANLVYSFTNERTGSSKEMTFDEAVDLIGHLRGVIAKQEANLTPDPSPKERGVIEKNKVFVFEYPRATGKTEIQKDLTRKYIISIWYRMENAKTKEECKEALAKCMNWVEKHFKAKLNTFEMVDLMKIKIAAENALRDRAAAVKKAMNEDT
jgi:methionine aminopeptidase